MSLIKKRSNVRGRIVYLGKSKHKKRDYKKMLKIISAVFLFLFICGALGYGAFRMLTWEKLDILPPNIDLSDMEAKKEVENRLAGYLASPVLKYFKKSNYFFFSEEELAVLLADVSMKVKTISVEKKWPRTLVVSFEMKEKAGMWCMAGKGAPDKTKDPVYVSGDCFYFNENGFLFEKDREIVSSFMLLVKDAVSKDLGIGQTLAPQNTLKYVLALHKEFTDKVGFLADYFLIEDPSYEDLAVFSSEGYYIKVNINTDPQKIISNFRYTMEELKGKEIVYLDLRIPDRVSYKLR